jgi:hypothetical protein
VKLKGIYAVVLILSLTALVACGSPASGGASAGKESADKEEVVGMANPWTETTDLEEVKKGSGIDLAAPEEVTLLDGFAIKTYRYMDDLLEVVYENGEDELIIRVSTQLSGTELSGDYNEYSKEWDVSLKGLTVHCKGDGTYANCAIADLEDIHFAVLYDVGQEGKGLDEQDLMSIFMGIQASPLKGV